MWKSLLLLYVVSVLGDEGEWKQIDTKQGPVRGRKDDAGMYIFRNIPYATVGPNRFGAPVPAPIWLQPLETPEQEIICPQSDTTLFKIEDKLMKEECLVATVYVPITTEKNLPVVVYVHGGAFELGYGNILSPKNFVKQNNVIVVTFNYRLGVHGFLCLGTESIPGNAGMKDQVELLRWVKSNIASYGGNPEGVTIAGCSAGSISVDLLMLSKSAQGLFNKVIEESGVGLASIAVHPNPLESAKTLARKLNFTNVDDIYELERFYKNTPLDKLLVSTFIDNTDVTLPFGPCLERIGSSSAFLSDTPLNIIKNKDYKQVPVLNGFADSEGLVIISEFREWKNKMNEKFSDFLPADLVFEDESQKEEVANKIKKFYFGDKPISEDTVLSFVDYYSDVYFVYPTLRTVKLHAESGHKEIYLYEFSFVDDVVTPTVPHTKVRGAPHCYQSFTIFDGVGLNNGTDENYLSQEFKNMKKTMREIWNNFVRRGKPVPEGSSLPSWPAVGANRSPYMSLGKVIELRDSLVESRVKFWDDIYQKYYQEPISPPKPSHTEL